MGFAPTAEQVAIRDAARVEKDLIVEAGAGAGKTSTLRLLGNDQPKDRCLYVAYNKSTQVEAAASFPPNVRCQPDGTVVRVPSGQGKRVGWTEVPIESLSVGDSVVSWNAGDSGGIIRKRGCRVVDIVGRPYSGQLVVVETDGRRSRYTPEHPCIVSLTDAFTGQHFVYMMRRGGHFKIGYCSWDAYKNRSSLAMRIKQEDADALWLLSAHNSRDEASLAEALTQHEWQIPGWCFRQAGSGGSFTQLWSKIAPNSDRAAACLTHFGRNIELPFWSRGASRAFGRSVFITAAANIVDGMKMLVADNAVAALHNDGCNDRLQTPRRVWTKVSVDREEYIGTVTSLEIETDHTYIADGILTHNCRTAHALAYAGTIGHYGDRVAKARMGSIPSRELLERLHIWEPFPLDNNPEPLTPKTIAEMVARTLTRFTTSADSQITRFHMPRVAGLEEDTNKALAEHVADYAQRAWDDYSRPQGALTLTPNVYLKLWQLTRPRLRFDTIFFDEAQDANGAMAAVINGQSCRRRAVGDSCQAINGWNGAVDAMAKWDWPRLMLTQSFRFGPKIAELANLWLESLDADLRLSGLESIDSRIVDEMEDPSAILCRTNMGVIDAALGQLAQGRRVAVVGGIGDAALLAQAAADLRAGRRTRHPDLAAFRSWEEFAAFVKHDPDGEDFRVLVSLVETYGTDQILALKRSLCDREADAEVTVSTCHKSKGREWDSVLIGQDFTPRSDEETGEPMPLSREQRMLAYVAVTRAKRALCPGPLASAE